MPKSTWNRWTEHENSVIQQLRNTHTTRQLSEVLVNRTPAAIKKHARELLGATRTYDGWSEQEEDRLKIFHPLMPREKLTDVLPGRTEASIRNKLLKMGLTKMDPSWKYDGMSIPLAYLIGMYLTDGHISLNGYSGSLCLTISVIDREFVEDSVGAYADTCGKIYGEPRRIIRENGFGNGSKPKPQWTIGLVCNDLNRWILEKTERKGKIPNEIFSADKETKLSFIAGMLDGDGWAGKRKNSNCSTNAYSVGFCSASLWIYDFARILNSIGIRTGKVSTRILKSGKEFHDMRIDKETFVLSGGYFRIKRKQSRINEYAMAKLGFSPQRLNVPPPMGDAIVRASRRLEEIGGNGQSVLNAQ